MQQVESLIDTIHSELNIKNKINYLSHALLLLNNEYFAHKKQFINAYLRDYYTIKYTSPLEFENNIIYLNPVLYIISIIFTKTDIKQGIELLLNLYDIIPPNYSIIYKETYIYFYLHLLGATITELNLLYYIINKQPFKPNENKQEEINENCIDFLSVKYNKLPHNNYFSEYYDSISLNTIKSDILSKVKQELTEYYIPDDILIKIIFVTLSILLNQKCTEEFVTELSNAFKFNIKHLLISCGKRKLNLIDKNYIISSNLESFKNLFKNSELFISTISKKYIPSTIINFDDYSINELLTYIDNDYVYSSYIYNKLINV